MVDMVDAINPDNIPPTFNGYPALKITTTAARQGQAFDYSDIGNAGAQAVALAIEWRTAQGFWSIAYTDQSQYNTLTQAARGGSWVDAAAWPHPGVYLWAADPSGNIARGAWKLPVTPLAVQDRYQGSVDLSRLYGPFPGRVAGYIDGARSVWPAAAWERFTLIPDRAPQPIPTPPEEINVQGILNTADGTLLLYGSSKDQGGNTMVMTFNLASHAWDVFDGTDALKAERPTDQRAQSPGYQLA